MFRYVVDDEVKNMIKFIDVSKNHSRAGLYDEVETWGLQYNLHCGDHGGCLLILLLKNC